ncbi:hypothetical protein A2U01_0090860, partial [Trifolium medium]|nr:hypothetical protein [Trifolium medium]
AGFANTCPTRPTYSSLLLAQRGLASSSRFLWLQPEMFCQFTGSVAFSGLRQKRYAKSSPFFAFSGPASS